jgi:outer membrane protein TolC
MQINHPANRDSQTATQEITTITNNRNFERHTNKVRECKSYKSLLRWFDFDLAVSKYLRLMVIGIGVATLAGCSTLDPQPLSVEEINGLAESARVESNQGVAPIEGDLTLEQAIARAMKYNLSWRIRMMEEALSRNQFDVGRYDMLPKLTASAGYSARNNYHLTSAVDSVTGEPSLSNPFISNDREHTTTGLGLTWNTLDFGISYYNAKQNADRLLVAMEKRRKAMHTLIQDVNAAYWRAASAQALKPQVREAIELAEDALNKSRTEHTEQLHGAEESLRYQRQLLENLRLLEIINKQLASAKVELAHLINAPVGEEIKLAEMTFDLPHEILKQPIAELEKTAIDNNAEVRRKIYDTRIAVVEAKKTLLKVFPRLNLNFDYKQDDDRYLVNDSWREAGGLISFNLFNLLSLDSRQKFAEAGVALSEQKMMATLMAVIAKVHIARLDYKGAQRQFKRADEVWQVDNQLRQHTSNAVKYQTQGELQLVAQRTITVLSLLRRYQAYADAQAAAGRLQASLGLEPQIGSVYETSLSELVSAVERGIARWYEGVLPDTKAVAETVKESTERSSTLSMQ